MSIEILILSGPRQGQRLVLDGAKLRAGPNPNCEIYFDPSADAAVRDRSVALSLMDDGWYIQSTGPGEVFVNQNPVVGLTRLRSGSVVRMSESGPEFEFRILGRSPGPAFVPPLPPRPARTAGAVRGSPDPAPRAVRGSPDPAREPTEGLRGTRETFGQPIGVVRKPSPGAGVGRPAPSAHRASRPLDSSRLVVIIGGCILACLVIIIFINLTRHPSAVLVQGDGKPAAGQKDVRGVEPVIDKQASSVAKDVSQPPEPKKPAEATTPPDAVKSRLEGAVLLIEVEKAGQFWPFATCSALSDNTVLTSAREAMKLGAWIHGRGPEFKGWVTNPATGLKLPIRDTRIFAVSVSFAEKPNDWLFTNLGLVIVQGKLPKTVELAGPEALAQLTPGKTVYDYSYVHEGDLITPADHLVVRGTPAKILFIDVHPYLPGKPRVLGVKAELPKFPLGSPLVNAEGKVVAVYSDPVASPSPTDRKGASKAAENMHYATLVNPGAIDLWLKKADRSVWVSTADLKIPAADSKISPASPTFPAAGSTAPSKIK